jgi:hypothetical protein
MDERALTIRQPAQMSLSDTMSLAEAFTRSGFFSDADDVAKAIVKIQAGRELGIAPVASMTGVYIVKGRVTLSANILASLVKKHPAYDYRVDRLDDAGCEIYFYQNGETIGASEFTMDDAAKAGLANGQNWRNYPRNMLFARAMSNGVKWYCPDVMGGAPVYTPDEMGREVDESGGIRLFATNEQLDAVRERLVALFPGVTFENDGHYNYVLKTNGYPKLGDMTAEQADNVIDSLQPIEPATDEGIDANGVDEITAEDLSGGAMDADGYEDLKEEQRPGRDISQLVPQHWGELYEMAEQQYKVTPKAHVVNIIKKTYPDFTARGKEQPTVIAAWNAFVAYEQSKAE